MVTFYELGRHGRFGNQLFQIATTIGTAVANGHDFIFPYWSFSTEFKNSIPQSSATLPETTISERSFAFEEIKIPYENDRLISLYGYFQSERYFIRSQDLIRHYFAPSDQNLEFINRKYGAFLEPGTSLTIFVRRGDYATLPDHHPMQPIEYYMKALEFVAPEGPTFISSDDLDWCRKNFMIKNAIFLDDPPIISFFVGTLCKNVIISNSTFGWWAAWLNKNSPIICAPANWFGPAYSSLSTADLIPSNWSVLK